MAWENRITDLSGITVIVLSLFALAESLLQTSIIGEQLPLVKGAIISLFALGFGATLLTQGATTALTQFKKFCHEKIV